MSLPPRDKLMASVSRIFAEVKDLSRKELMARLSAEYHMDFTPFKKNLDEFIIEILNRNAKLGEKKAPSASKAKKSKDEPPAAKKSKHEKVEGQPKRAQTAFFFFSDKHRPAVMDEVKKENGGKTDVTEVSKRLGALWKAATDAERAPFEAMAAKDKARHASEQETFLASGGAEAIQKAKAKGKTTEDGQQTGKAASKEKKVKPDGPKRPMNSTFLYITANRERFKATHPDMKPSEVVKSLSEEYKNLSDAKKQEWVDKAAKDKARYESEKAAR